MMTQFPRTTLITSTPKNPPLMISMKDDSYGKWVNEIINVLNINKWVDINKLSL